MSKLKAKEREDFLAEISELRVEVSGLNQRLMRADMYQNSLQKDLEEQKEKYADLLQKHIQMMERCVSNECFFKEIAEERCNKGYRKVLKGAVILTRASSSALNEYQKRLKGQHDEAVATKVAKEILDWIERSMVIYNPEIPGLRIISMNVLNTLKKKYTEEGK